jgi:hypothetical protein
MRPPSASPPSSCGQSLLSLILIYDITAPPVIFFSGFVFCSGPTRARRELGLPAQHPYKGRAKTLGPVPYPAERRRPASSLFSCITERPGPLPFLSCSHANAARTPRSASPSLCCPGRRPCAVRTIRRTAAIAPFFFCTEPPCPCSASSSSRPCIAQRTTRKRRRASGLPRASLPACALGLCAASPYSSTAPALRPLSSLLAAARTNRSAAAQNAMNRTATVIFLREIRSLRCVPVVSKVWNGILSSSSFVSPTSRDLSCPKSPAI